MSHGDYKKWQCRMYLSLIFPSSHHAYLLQVPNGFHGVLESFSKEVLRAQPDDVITFAVTYFEGKLNQRRGRRGE